MAPDARRYAAIVAPLDPAVNAFEAKSAALARNASVDDFVAIASPLAETVAAVDRQLRASEWPPSSRADVRSELAADRALTAYLRGTLDVTLILSVWRHQIVGAAARAQAAERRVTVELARPPT